MPLIEVKNNFARHGLLWWITLPVVAVLMLPMWLPASAFRIEQAELDFFANSGRNIADVSTSADAAFKAAFVDTRISMFISEFLVGATSIAEHSQAARTATGVARRFNNALWAMVYRAIWRLCALRAIYVAILLSMIVPAFVDGLVTRAKKRFNFQLHNPVYFYSSMHSLVLILGLGLLIPLMPITLSPTVLGVLATLLALALWVSAANFQTGG